jgi:DNA polymerase III epsilon subunit-like protein
MTTCPLLCCTPRPFAVVDVETTGLDHRDDRVVEIAVIWCDGDGRIEAEPVHTLVHPGGPVEATHIHGITDADVADAPTFDDIAGDVIDALAGRVFVAHNAVFDIRFVSNSLERAGRRYGALSPHERFPLIPVMCTMWSSGVVDGLGGMVSLSHVADTLDVALPRAHDALHDARAAAGIAAELLTHARRTGRHVRPFGDPHARTLRVGDYPALPRLVRTATR